MVLRECVENLGKPRLLRYPWSRQPPLFTWQEDKWVAEEHAIPPTSAPSWTANRPSCRSSVEGNPIGSQSQPDGLEGLTWLRCWLSTRENPVRFPGVTTVLWLRSVFSPVRGGQKGVSVAEWLSLAWANVLGVWSRAVVHKLGSGDP